MSSPIIKTTEWEGENVRLVKLGGLPLHPNFPRGMGNSRYFEHPEGKPIKGVVAHTTAGPRRAGLSAALGLAKWVIRDPVYQRDESGAIVYRKTRSGRKRPKVTGGGRGWPGPPYTFLVPHIPETVDGKLEVYRLWDDTWHTWHTGKAVNADMRAVAFAGMFRTRHSPRFSSEPPHPLAMEAGQSLILDYLLPRYNLTTDDVYGHFDFGKAACPGDDIEQWIREVRGEDVEFLAEDEEKTSPVSVAPLDSWKERQEALVSLGYDVGRTGADGLFGFYTRRAVESFQADAGLVSDGIWGPRTDRAMRLALAKSKP